MAIQLYCQVCKTYAPVAAKKCPKCDAAFPREGRKYRVDVTVKGKRTTRFCDNLTIAREVEGTIRSDLVREEFDITRHKVKKTLTLDDVWKKYLPWAKEHKKSWKDDELYYGKHIEPCFGKKALDAITHLDIERMKTEFLTEEEFQRLIDTIDSWPYCSSACLFKFSLFTGVRQGELRKLTWDAVDFEHSLITLKDPKSGKTETVAISAEALDVLMELNVVSEYVFPNPDGGMKGRSAVIDTWRSMKKHAKLSADFRFHGLRHNFASWLVSNGVDLATVQKLMTHKHASTTQRYAHVMPGAVKDAAAKAGKLFSSIGKPAKAKVIGIGDSERPD